ncbi:hypothetical protein [Streptomyces sp. NPDC006640]|uniref:hypothetical protein n=1 Tax=unclassified Streptomyces TaxID=2593676 RepID=UPI0036A11046
MRNIVSTNSGADVDENYADAVQRELESAQPERETTQLDDGGQTAYWVRLYSYPAPGSGETVWAVDYNDPVSRELEETASHAEATERYEEFVRDSAENLTVDNNGFVERFTTTDVAGVPGPLPDLPEVTHEDLDALLDAPVDTALYLALADDDSADYLAVKRGPLAGVDPAHVIMTRTHLVTDLGLSDDATSATAQDRLNDAAMEMGFRAWESRHRVRGAADALLPDGI